MESCDNTPVTFNNDVKTTSRTLEDPNRRTICLCCGSACQPNGRNLV